MLAKPPGSQPLEAGPCTTSAHTRRRAFRVRSVAVQGSPGICHVYGRGIQPDTAFVNVGPTDWNDSSKPQAARFVRERTDIHGWTPFVVAHPECFAQTEGQDALDALLGGAE